MSPAMGMHHLGPPDGSPPVPPTKEDVLLILGICVIAFSLLGLFVWLT